MSSQGRKDRTKPDNLHFFASCKMPKMVNSSVIALIPKHSNANHMSHFHPISCCNAIYKCIGKMIAQRMLRVMCSLVSLNQTAFVPTRSLGDNVFLAQALCRESRLQATRDYHLDTGPSRIACKLDIREAFDTLNWLLILKVLGDSFDFSKSNCSRLSAVWFKEFVGGLKFGLTNL